MVRVRGELGIGKAEAKDCWAAWGPPEFGDSEGTNMPERPHQGSSVTDELAEASGEPTPSEGEQGVEGLLRGKKKMVMSRQDREELWP